MTQNDEGNSVSWSLTGDGSFSIKSTYSLLTENLGLEDGRPDQPNNESSLWNAV